MQGVSATSPVSPTQSGGRSHTCIQGAPRNFREPSRLSVQLVSVWTCSLRGGRNSAARFCRSNGPASFPGQCDCWVETRQSPELVALQTGTPRRSGGTHARARARTPLFAVARSLWIGVRPSRAREPEFRRMTPVHSLGRHRRNRPVQNAARHALYQEQPSSSCVPGTGTRRRSPESTAAAASHGNSPGAAMPPGRSSAPAVSTGSCLLSRRTRKGGS